MNTNGRSNGSGACLVAMPNEHPATNELDTPVSRLYSTAKQELAAKAEILPAIDTPSSAFEMREALITDLTALMGLHLQYKVYEWTVEGSSWFAHRSLFVELGFAVAKSIDLLADRIVGLGGTPVPTASCQIFQAHSGADSTVPKLPQEMVSASLKAEREMIERFDTHRSIAGANGDYLTSDVLKHLRSKHGRHIEDLLLLYEDGLNDSQ